MVRGSQVRFQSTKSTLSSDILFPDLPSHQITYYAQQPLYRFSLSISCLNDPLPELRRPPDLVGIVLHVLGRSSTSAAP
jgi:hypothetical protein